jgi:hypothetical protein
MTGHVHCPVEQGAGDRALVVAAQGSAAQAVDAVALEEHGIALEGVIFQRIGSAGTDRDGAGVAHAPLDQLSRSAVRVIKNCRATAAAGVFDLAEQLSVRKPNSPEPFGVMPLRQPELVLGEVSCRKARVAVNATDDGHKCVEFDDLAHRLEAGPVCPMVGKDFLGPRAKADHRMRRVRRAVSAGLREHELGERSGIRRRIGTAVGHAAEDKALRHEGVADDRAVGAYRVPYAAKEHVLKFALGHAYRAEIAADVEGVARFRAEGNEAFGYLASGRALSAFHEAKIPTFEGVRQARAAT